MTQFANPNIPPPYTSESLNGGFGGNTSDLERAKMFSDLREELRNSDTWAVNNLEYSLTISARITQKILDSRTYAQNLYAALCNNEFVQHDAYYILTETYWSCSWRYAGGIVADIRNDAGGYMEYYCSRIGGGLGNGDPDGSKGHVPEGVVTDEVRIDLDTLGWSVITPPDTYS